MSTTSAATQGERPHSKPPFWTMLLAGVGLHVGVIDAVEDTDVCVVDRVEAMVGLQEQAELYRAGLVPQEAEALLGKPVVIVLILVV